jgi:Tfp pilus assembly protein PilX
MRIELALFRRQSVNTENHCGISVIRNRKESGIALITSLLLLILMSILGIGMVLAVNSDMLINGYYGNYRSSFYAADSGLNLVRQQLMNQIMTNVNNAAGCASWGASSTANYGCTYFPLACTSSSCAPATNAYNTVVSSFGSSFQPLNGGSSAGSQLSGRFELVTSGGNASSFALYASPSAACGGTSQPLCQYTFKYTLNVLGSGPGPLQVMTSESGYMNVIITPNGGAPMKQSFSQFGAFIGSFTADSSPLVYGTIEGPQWTNGSWNFGSGGTYTFTGTVSQSGAKASYDFTGNGCNPYCYVDSANTSATYGTGNNAQTIAPNFEGGLNVGQTAAPLPPDDFSQKWAVLDSMGCGEGSNVCGSTSTSNPSPPTVTSTILNQHLLDATGAKYSTSGESSGVYIPYTGAATTGTTTTGTMNGGGFYVEGGADSILLTPGTDTHGNLTQIYTIAQGNTQTTITTNIAANTTTVQVGTISTSHGNTTVTVTNTANLTGVPVSKVTGTVPQTLLYVNGDIGGSSGYGNNATYTGLSGPGEGQAGIQSGVQLSVVANGDINVVGDLMYTSSTAVSTRRNSFNTSDTYTAANDNGQVLGLFTQSGNLVLNSTYNDNNLEIDGSMAAIGSNCTSSSCGLETPGNGINQLTIYGGRSEAFAHGVTIGTSNTWYDSSGHAPPFFPSTIIQPSGAPTAPTVTPSYSRLNWKTSPQN